MGCFSWLAELLGVSARVRAGAKSRFSGGPSLASHIRRDNHRGAMRENGKLAGSAFEHLLEVLDADGIKYQADFAKQVASASFRCESGAFRVHILVEEEAALIQVFGPVPFTVPEGARRSIAEAIAWANYGMRLGKFEMDFRDGELRFHLGNRFSHGGLDDEIVRHLLGCSLSMLDRYSPAFLAVIYGNELPEDAVRQVEQLTE